MDLLDLRKQIEKVDKKLAKLFEQRIKIIEKVRKYKIANKLNIYDCAREKEMHEKYSKFIKNREFLEYYLMFVENNLIISKKYMHDKNQVE